ncbi:MULTISPECIES: hypothetical protein [unclassified Pseudomonas]|uniref:hypothetical protein n=1 Tax=unclassified Pseudomonas TaxID=196821 RepID=UPI00128D87F7|nr:MULTISPECIES: hypothetical protein [unclassified Pseudomonas]MPQ71119.1 hypothetical protein [Pseudomonas sp. MWU12-2323]
MNPYIYYPGVRRWTRTDKIECKNACTITILGNSLGELKKTWRDIEKALLNTWPTRFRWSSSGFSNFQSKSHEYIAQKSLREKMLPDDFLSKNEKTGIYSYIKIIAKADRDVDIETYMDPDSTALLFLKNNKKTAKDLWTAFSHADKELSSRHINKLMKTYEDLIICIFSEDSDTHAAAQLICSKKNSSPILQEIKKQNHIEIPENLVHLYINKELDIKSISKLSTQRSTHKNEKPHLP